MSDELLLRRLRIGWHDDDTPIWVSDAMTEAADRIEALTAQLTTARADYQIESDLREVEEALLKAAEAERDRLLALLAEADRRIVWEALGFGSDFADQVQAALKGETP